MSQAEEGHVRLPLPTPEVIAALPSHGGPDFNRLVFEQSPYLLQHARNPVDWWPWGEEAFTEAKRLDKPVFLSVGYATCHWCHVMEHESFEDDEVAALINEYFIPVKVDREERPDIDEIYMQITQAITGGGGWPMTVVMTPDKHAFFAGTYFPKESKPGRPGVKRLAEELNQFWNERREEAESIALNISEQLGDIMGSSPGGELEPSIFETAFSAFSERYDEKHGGFAVRPKFPVPPNLMFLLRYHRRTGNEAALEMVEKTLTEMRRGGIYDHVGFGIHRYSTDSEWLVPHFEKMLYDQALVTRIYLEAYQVTGKERYARTAREILAYVQRDMTSATGGFYSAEDADSEGEEGKFYVWTNEEVSAVLGDEDGAFYRSIFQFADEGNFLDEVTQKNTGSNIPHLDSELDGETADRVEKLRMKLFEAREERVHPFKDDKILTDWNGLMISAFAKAAQTLGDASYVEAATKATDFVLETLTDDKGRLLKRYRQGEAGLTAHLEDYVFMISALLDVYETAFEIRYLDQAITFQRIIDEFFWDEEDGGYFTVADDAEQLIVRAKKLYGGAIPSGNAMAMENLVRLHRMTGQPHFETRGEELIRAFSGEIEKNSMVYPLVLSGLDFYFGPSLEIVISGNDPGEMLKAVRKPFLPNKVILRRTEENSELLTNLAPYTEFQLPLDGKATAYVCEDFACQLPTTEISVLKESLGLKGGDQ
ncbi:MAG: thioredoxin domain-containing protein [Verrucomicrobiales bacterium]|nr:thioredoxin domain-containing protein [Verrucomicrobiales bacterium]